MAHLRNQRSQPAGGLPQPAAGGLPQPAAGNLRLMQSPVACVLALTLGRVAGVPLLVVRQWSGRVQSTCCPGRAEWGSRDLPFSSNLTDFDVSLSALV